MWMSQVRGWPLILEIIPCFVRFGAEGTNTSPPCIKIGLLGIFSYYIYSNTLTEIAISPRRRWEYVWWWQEFPFQMKPIRHVLSCTSRVLPPGIGYFPLTGMRAVAWFTCIGQLPGRFFVISVKWIGKKDYISYNIISNRRNKHDL
jgi:hypothetical protein